MQKLKVKNLEIREVGIQKPKGYDFRNQRGKNIETKEVEIQKPEK